MSVPSGTIALIGYTNPTMMIVVTLQATTPITDREVDLSSAVVHFGKQGELMPPLKPRYSRGTDEVGFTPAWYTDWQRLTLAYGAQFVWEYNAMQRRSVRLAWRNEEGEGLADIRPLDAGHFDIDWWDHGMRITSKPRQIVYVGRGPNRTVAVTMIGDDRTTAEFYMAEDLRSMVLERVVASSVAVDPDDDQAYTIHMGGQGFTYQEATVFRKGFFDYMREGGVGLWEAWRMSRSLTKDLPKKGYFGNYAGGLTTITDLSGFRLDHENGTIRLP